MKNFKCLCIAATIFASQHTLVNAMDTVEGTQADLYTLERDGDNFVRLNRETGKMSVCFFKDADLVCRMASDERDALLSEIETLTVLVEELSSNKDTGLTNNGKEKLQKSEKDIDAEIEKAIDYSTKIMRRFFEAMKEMREDFKSDVK